MARDVLESTMTQKGQVTIPQEIRERLGLKPKDRVRFEIENDVVVLKPVGSTLARGFGAVRPLSRPEDFSALRADFEQGVADQASDQPREIR